MDPSSLLGFCSMSEVIFRKKKLFIILEYFTYHVVSLLGEIKTYFLILKIWLLFPNSIHGHLFFIWFPAHGVLEASSVL